MDEIKTDNIDIWTYLNKTEDNISNYMDNIENQSYQVDPVYQQRVDNVDNSDKVEPSLSELLRNYIGDNQLIIVEQSGVVYLNRTDKIPFNIDERNIIVKFFANKKPILLFTVWHSYGKNYDTCFCFAYEGYCFLTEKVDGILSLNSYIPEASPFPSDYYLKLDEICSKHKICKVKQVGNTKFSILHHYVCKKFKDKIMVYAGFHNDLLLPLKKEDIDFCKKNSLSMFIKSPFFPNYIEYSTLFYIQHKLLLDRHIGVMFYPHEEPIISSDIIKFKGILYFDENNKQNIIKYIQEGIAKDLIYRFSNKDPSIWVCTEIMKIEFRKKDSPGWTTIKYY